MFEEVTINIVGVANPLPLPQASEAGNLSMSYSETAAQGAEVAVRLVHIVVFRYRGHWHVGQYVKSSKKLAVATQQLILGLLWGSILPVTPNNRSQLTSTLLTHASFRLTLRLVM